MRSELIKLQGLGKLSKTYLYRLVRRTVTCSDGVTRSGASKCELLSVIYLSQIADPSGYIKQFHIKDFARVLRCSEREVYVIMDNLVAKQYISAKLYQNKKWTGFRNIRLLGNDFSKIKKYTGEHRYLSTFYSFFDWSDANMAALDKLSLYALRFLLLLLFEYDFKHGCNMNINLVCEQLGIDNKKLICKYLAELKEHLLYDSFFQLKAYKKKTNHYVHIYSKNSILIAESKPSDKQLTYYKRKWLLHLTEHNALFYNNTELVKHSPSYSVSCNDVLNQLFTIVSAYLIKGHLLEKIERVIETVLAESEYIIDILVLARIGARLQAQLDLNMSTTK